MSQQPVVDTATRGRIFILTLKRPGEGNRITTQMAQEVAAALRVARDDPSVGACVITGYGEVFCLGGDYVGAGPTAAGRAAYAKALLEMDQAMCCLGKPLVAAVNGDAHAGGFSMVVGCDLAVMADGATLGLPEAAKGLFPLIALAIVKDTLPKKLLFDIVYNARLMSAEEARSAHLVNHVVARGTVLDCAITAAQTAASYNPEILKIGRDLYYGMRGAAPADALEQARMALAAALDVHAKGR